MTASLPCSSRACDSASLRTSILLARGAQIRLQSLHFASHSVTLPRGAADTDTTQLRTSTIPRCCHSNPALDVEMAIRINLGLQDCDRTVTELRYELTHYDKPWTVNDERGGRNSVNHWSKIHPLKKEWRRAFSLLAKQAKIPHFNQIRVEVRHVSAAKNEAHIPDTGNCYGAVKAAIDGLVDAKVIDKDTRKYVTFIGFHAPERGSRDALSITVIGDESDRSPVPASHPSKPTAVKRKAAIRQHRTERAPLKQLARQA